MVRGVVDGRDAARERRPDRVMVVWQEPQTAVPVPPEHLDRAISPGVVPKGRGRPNVSSLGE
jgi:hypothetical protein